MVDTVPAGIIKVLFQGWLSPCSLHTRLHPVVAVIDRSWAPWVLGCMMRGGETGVLTWGFVNCLRRCWPPCAHRLVGIEPVWGGGCLVVPCHFLTSYKAAGLYAILLFYSETVLTLACPFGCCLSYHPALSAIVTTSTAHQPLPGVVNSTLPCFWLAFLSSWP